MYVCLCKGITENQIRQAAADGATTLGAVRQKLGVSTECGKCRCDARDILRSMVPVNNAPGLFHSAA